MCMLVSLHLREILLARKLILPLLSEFRFKKRCHKYMHPYMDSVLNFWSPNAGVFQFNYFSLFGICRLSKTDLFQLESNFTLDLEKTVSCLDLRVLVENVQLTQVWRNWQILTITTCIVPTCLLLQVGVLQFIPRDRWDRHEGSGSMSFCYITTWLSRWNWTFCNILRINQTHGQNSDPIHWFSNLIQLVDLSDLHSSRALDFCGLSRNSIRTTCLVWIYSFQLSKADSLHFLSYTATSNSFI